MTKAHSNPVGLKTLYNSGVRYFKKMLTAALGFVDLSESDGGYSDWADSNKTAGALKVFSEDYQKLQVAIANQTIKQTLKGTALRNIKNGLNAKGKKFLTENVLAKCTSIDDTLKARMQAIFMDIKKNDGTLLDLKQALRAEFNGVIKDGKLDTIANTEFNSAYNYGKNDALEALNDKLGEDGKKLLKVWMQSGNANTRATHQIDGETVEMDEAFSNGLMYPCDPDGPPEEVINCDCTMGYKEVDK